VGPREREEAVAAASAIGCAASDWRERRPWRRRTPSGARRAAGGLGGRRGVWCGERVVAPSGRRGACAEQQEEYAVAACGRRRRGERAIGGGSRSSSVTGGIRWVGPEAVTKKI